ncbi:ribonuclease-like [Python bivittatus]|uniref:Ribonuclease-like n=1 Tax=Python bivittatus TaxID=176946 RepID=A0A9F5MYR1_PYTBI|nr:ribonuclease-like [Python bivittatus]XP_025031280.1 ribonuclease-like [Python bivittatus]
MSQMLAYSVLLLFVALLRPLPTLVQKETRQEKFHRQHVAFPKTDSELGARRYCNLMMQRRGMTAIRCKPTNTFIHGSPTEVDAICSDGGTHSSENYYDSNSFFELTACRLTGEGSRPPNCNYRGRLSTQQIRVACINGVPVHFKTHL